MALIDRLARNAPFPLEGVDHIPAHQFSAACWFLTKGDLTQAQVITGFELSVEDQVQFQQLIAFWNTLNATEKGQFHSRLESALVLLAEDRITRAKFKTLLGMT